MNLQNQNSQPLIKAFGYLLNLLIILVVIIVGLTIALIHFIPKSAPHNEVMSPQVASVNETLQPVGKKTSYWTPPDTSTLKNISDKEKILYGRELVANTSLHFGPNGKTIKGFTNGLNCQNCHLDAGTKVFGNNYSAVVSTYPKYRARSGTTEDLSKRINDCFERSLNGKPLDVNSREMQSMIAYISWLGKDVAKGIKPEGSGLKQITFLSRAADPVKGKSVYEQKCQSCHRFDGEGTLNENKTAYVYPPLWGEHSYNTGAGLFRISNFARFVKYNMPLGASHDNTILSDEEAWDVAAFVNSQPRPKKNTKNDWPKITEKPFDHPFGPYADDFTEAQHKYGPYQPIIDHYAKSTKK